MIQYNVIESITLVVIECGETIMSWKLIFLLSIFGLVMGLVTVSLVPSTIEPFCWLVVFVISSYLIARYAGSKYFVHGFSVSVLNSIWLTVVHAVFFTTYSASHPEYMQMIQGLPPALSANPRGMMFLTGPISGAIFGLVLGLVSWIASKILNRSLI